MIERGLSVTISEINVGDERIVQVKEFVNLVIVYTRDDKYK